MSGADPVKVGLVLSRPNGNLTGMRIFLSALGPKRVELLHELLPAVKAIALLGNPRHPNFQLDAPDIRAAADTLMQRFETLAASTETDLEVAFATMVQHRLGDLIVEQTHFSSPGENRLLSWQPGIRCLRFIHPEYLQMSVA